MQEWEGKRGKVRGTRVTQCGSTRLYTCRCQPVWRRYIIIHHNTSWYIWTSSEHHLNITKWEVHVLHGSAIESDLIVALAESESWNFARFLDGALDIRPGEKLWAKSHRMSQISTDYLQIIWPDPVGIDMSKTLTSVSLVSFESLVLYVVVIDCQRDIVAEPPP